MQIIPQPFPPHHLLHAQPRFPIRQRQEEPPTPHHERHDDPRGAPQREHAIPTDAVFGRHDPLGARAGAFHAAFVTAGCGHLGVDILLQGDRVEVEDKFEEGAGDEGGGEVGGEIVMQEELAAHEVEGEVVSGPGEEEEASAVVEAGAGAWGVISELVDFLGEVDGLVCKARKGRKRDLGVRI